MTVKKPTTTKSSSTRPATSKATPAAPSKPDPTEKPVAPQPMLRRKELVARIVASTGMKPNQVKSVLDGVLAELGNALAAGEAVNVPPLGKLVVKRSKTVGDHDIMVCKLRRKTAAAVEKAALEPVTS